MRYVITGGAGFLGTHLQENLHRRGVKPADIFVPKIEDFDLTQSAAVDRLYREAKPDVVIHLAAQVGGIGANRENPGRYFYANMAMGLHLIEHAAPQATSRSSSRSAPSAPIPTSRPCRSRKTTSGTATPR